MDRNAARVTVRQTSSGDPLGFDVEPDDARFEVKLARGDFDRLGAGRSGIEVVTAAFRFLLDREPKEAILRRFDLSVISRCFPSLNVSFLATSTGSNATEGRHDRRDCGHIIGSRFEGHPSPPAGFELFHRDCRFTDDTVCTIAVADAIMRQADFAATLRAYVRRHPDAGYGGMFLRWAFTDDAPAYGSWGNGAPMRVAAVGWLAADAEEADALAAAQAGRGQSQSQRCREGGSGRGAQSWRFARAAPCRRYARGSARAGATTFGPRSR